MILAALSGLVLTLCQRGISAEDLCWAAQAGDLEAIRELVKDGAPVDDPCGNKTPLMWASSKGQMEAALLLIELGADRNATDIHGWTAIRLAAWHGHTRVVELLLAEGADPLVGNEERAGSLLLMAARHDDPELIRLTAAVCEHPEEASGAAHRTAIELTSVMGHANSLGELLRIGISPGTVAQGGHQLLHLAALADQAAVARVLLASAARPLEPDLAGRTPLHYAAHRPGRLFRALLDECNEQGLDLAVPDQRGLTAAHFAALGNHPEVFRSWRAGAVTAPCALGRTPLHWAARMGHTASYLALLDAGALPQTVDSFGLQASDYLDGVSRDELDLAITAVDTAQPPEVALFDGLLVHGGRGRMVVGVWADGLVLFAAEGSKSMRVGRVPVSVVRMLTEELHSLAGANGVLRTGAERGERVLLFAKGGTRLRFISTRSLSSDMSGVELWTEKLLEMARVLLFRSIPRKSELYSGDTFRGLRIDRSDNTAWLWNE